MKVTLNRTPVLMATCSQRGLQHGIASFIQRLIALTCLFIGALLSFGAHASTCPSYDQKQAQCQAWIAAQRNPYAADWRCVDNPPRHWFDVYYLSLGASTWSYSNDQFIYSCPSGFVAPAAGANLGSGATCSGGEGLPGGGQNTAGVNGSARPRGCAAHLVGDPINAASGNKYVQEDDYDGPPWLTFRRFYNSATNMILHGRLNTMGAHWRHSFDRWLRLDNANTGFPATVTITRPDGQEEAFTKVNGLWLGNPSVVDTLTEIDSAQGAVVGYTVFIVATRHTETYDAAGFLTSVRDQTGNGVQLTYSDASTNPAIAPASGLLLSVVDPQGRSLQFTYYSNAHLRQVTIPDGGVYTYSYDTNYNLIGVQYPDGKIRQYAYNESSLNGGTSQLNALTGVVDEAGARYEDTGYDSSMRANFAQLSGGVGTTHVTYNSDGSSSVTYPLGSSSRMSFTTPNGVLKLATVDQPCGPQCDQPWQTRTYDASGYPASYTDFNNNITKTTYDSNGLLDQQIDASGTTSQRTTNTTWNTTLRVPLTRVVLDASNTTVSSTQWVYNTAGQTLARCEIDPTNSAATGYACSATGTVPAGVRRWTYTYCIAVDGVQCPLVGLLLTATGPRTDLTQTTNYSYYMDSATSGCPTPGSACHQPGDLHTVTDPAGHVTTIVSYDADGRITRETDANGVNTDLTYTPRGWLASRTVGGAQTTFGYTPYGSVSSVTDPDGVTTSYGYDAAHRLTRVTDAQGNYVQYTLDAAGNKTAEQVFDSSGAAHKSQSRTFNTLGQLTTVVDGLNHTVFNASAAGSYDANGNLVQSADGLGIQRQSSYDALDRLVKTLDNYNGTDPATQNTTTQYSYDSLDRLTRVTDPSNLATTFGYDGLSDATGQTSPDTGSTSRTFDAAGNVLTRTDAKGITATNTYDVLDRLSGTTYPDSTQNVAYHYDEANSITGCSSSYPVGRLTRIVENAVTTVHCYDTQGRVIEKQQIVGTTTSTTGYAYTAAGRLSGIVYPSGTLVSYTRDSDGRIQSLSVTPPNGTASTVVSSVSYQPFGPISGYTLGNGQAVTRTYDANYRLTDLTSPAFSLHVARDAMGDITAIGNAPGANPATETYSYDPLYRLTAITEAGGSTLESVTYNPTGDRLSKIGSGLATGTYSYNTNTHQLIGTGSYARAVDANGNTTAITAASGNLGFGYSDRNRMILAQLAGSTVGSYTYDALGERIGKVAGTANERYGYDEDQQLLSEQGATNRDYVWMDGIPVANVDTTGTTSTLAYVTADQLGTPRAVADTSGSTLWQWPYQGNAFEELAPTSSTGYVYNLRSVGEYFDAETGLNNNGFRTRDPGTWRFLQSDPLGLRGGISTYATVGNDPLSYVDPLGLYPAAAIPPSPWTVAAERAAIVDGIGGGPEDPVGDLAALGVFVGTAIAGEAAMNQNMSGWNTDPQAIAEYEAYKTAYRQPPPDGLDPCEKAKWQLAREEALLAARMAWDAQWAPGTHNQAIQESRNAVRNAQKRVEKACKCQRQK